MAGLLLCSPVIGRAAPSLVIQEISRQSLDENWASIELALYLEAASGIRAIEVRTRAAQTRGEERVLVPHSLGEGVMVFPTRRVGDPPDQVFAIVFPRRQPGEASDASISIGSARYRVARDAEEPRFLAQAIAADGKRVDVRVSYRRRPSDEPLSVDERDLVIAPNPTFGNVEVRFRLQVASPVEVSVHDLSGRRIRAVYRGPLGPGEHSVLWDGRDDAGALAPLGVYFLDLKLGRQVRSESLVLMR